MHDLPTPDELLAAVSRFLRDDAGPALGRNAPLADGAALAYQSRVAANMLDIVRRQVALSPATDAAEQARLQALLGEPGDLATLNRRLTDRIADGSLNLATPGLADHLWRTTLDKLAVDQPGYATYSRFAEATSPGPTAAESTPP